MSQALALVDLDWEADAREAHSIACKERYEKRKVAS